MLTNNRPFTAQQLENELKLAQQDVEIEQWINEDYVPVLYSNQQ